jgi:predicted GIY-YIG superfamily endonuclease
MVRNTGIYQIQSITKPERIYVGSSVNLIERFKEHKRTLRGEYHDNIRLQNHSNKYGIDDLVISPIEEFDFISKEHLSLNR